MGLKQNSLGGKCLGVWGVLVYIARHNSTCSLNQRLYFLSLVQPQAVAPQPYASLSLPLRSVGHYIPSRRPNLVCPHDTSTVDLLVEPNLLAT
eukprot:778207-Amphidinium_carterae.1